MGNELTRREFFGVTLPALVLAHLSSETSAGESSEFSYLNIHDDIINSTLSYFRGLHNISPDLNLIKAMIAVESGGMRHRETAFRYDPMQIANDRDYALDVLANRKEHTQMIGDFSFLAGKKHTPWINGRLDYSQTNMTPEDSIRGGVGWLYHKAAKRNYMGKELRITGWRDWNTAVERYNCGGNPDYLAEVLGIKRELERKD